MQSGILSPRRLKVSTLPLLARFWHSAIAIAVVLLLWELASKTIKIPEYILPRPTVIISGFTQYWATLGRNTFFTMMVTLSGLLIGTSSGIGLGVLAGESELVRKTVSPIVVAIQSVPKLALAPLLLLWFGYGLFPKVLLVAISTLFPLLIGTMAGFETVEPSHLDLMKTLQASRIEVLLKVRIPAAMPSIIAGLKVACTSAVVAAIVAEWVGSSSGLGYLMLLANSQLNTVLLFEALFLLSAAGILLIGVVALLESILLSWRAPTSKFANAYVRGTGVV